MGSDLVLQRHLQEQGLLDRFGPRAIAMAEEAGLEYIQLGGELWTRVAELERAKGVEPSDFQRQAGLRTASYEKSRMLPEPLQQLLCVPGVRKVTQPAKFAVDGGYAIHCGGDGASDAGGIWSLVREQRPDWVKAQAIFLNLPLTLAYLQHGASAVAHATRNLTIGTTIDVGRMAAASDNASLAASQFSDDPALQKWVMDGMLLMSQVAKRAETTAGSAMEAADRAEAKADRAEAKADRVERVLSGINKQRKAISKTRREEVKAIWEAYFYGECPCCHKSVTGEQGTMEIDHFWNDSDDLNNLWLVCKGCNIRMGKPGPQRSDMDKRRHETWRDRAGLKEMQLSLLAA